MPAWAASWLSNSLGLQRTRFELRMRDNNSGRLTSTMQVKLTQGARMSSSINVLSGFEPNFSVSLSPDGNWVAVHDARNVQVWELSPRRPLSCWLTCSALALLAVWVGWPRKGNSTVQMA